MADIMKIEIEEDGTISVTTDSISGTNHLSAEEFLNEITKLAGGERISKKRNRYGYSHTHANGVVHTH